MVVYYTLLYTLLLIFEIFLNKNNKTKPARMLTHLYIHTSPWLSLDSGTLSCKKSLHCHFRELQGNDLTKNFFNSFIPLFCKFLFSKITWGGNSRKIMILQISFQSLLLSFLFPRRKYFQTSVITFLPLVDFLASWPLLWLS